MTLPKITQEGLDVIKCFEGFSGTRYLCPAGKPTIGYGHVVMPGETYKTISKDDAEELLLSDIRKAEKAILHFITTPLTDNQYSALISLVFNLGSAPLTKTLGTLLNQYDYAGAAQQFDRWVYAGGQVLKGLVTRRAAEKALFLKP